MKERAFSDGLWLGMARWDWEGWGNCVGVFLGVVGAGSGVDAGCEPTGTSALPGGRCRWRARYRYRMGNPIRPSRYSPSDKAIGTERDSPDGDGEDSRRGAEAQRRG